MKIIFIIISLMICLLCAVWIIWSRPVEQSVGLSINNDLLTLSEKLLYQVKTDEPVDSIVNALSHYSSENLDRGLADDESRKVFWINLYNAWYQIFAIRDKKSKDAIYTDRDIPFADASLSLDDIEHGILRKYRWKYSFGYLPQFLPSNTIKRLAVTDIDFRIHFALNCGAKSCPPIAFYQYERLNEQLELATQTFLQSEITIDSMRHELRVTKIMQWFKGDFGGEMGIRKIVSKYLGEDYSHYTVKFKDYDWSDDLKNFVE